MRSLASFPAKMTTNETGSKRVPRNEAGRKSLPLSEKKESPVQVGEVMELTRKVFEAVSFYTPFPCTNDFLQSKSSFSQTNVSSRSAVTLEKLIGSKKRLDRIFRTKCSSS